MSESQHQWNRFPGVGLEQGFKNGSACNAIRPPHVPSRRLLFPPLRCPSTPWLPLRARRRGLGAAVWQGNGAVSQCGVAGRRRGSGLARLQPRRRRLLPVRLARREPRQRRGAALAACRDAAAPPLAAIAAPRSRGVGRAAAAVIGGG
jgi:hypothetical protein